MLAGPANSLNARFASCSPWTRTRWLQLRSRLQVSCTEIDTAIKDRSASSAYRCDLFLLQKQCFSIFDAGRKAPRRAQDRYNNLRRCLQGRSIGCFSNASCTAHAHSLPYLGVNAGWYRFGRGYSCNRGDDCESIVKELGGYSAKKSIAHTQSSLKFTAGVRQELREDPLHCP